MVELDCRLGKGWEAGIREALERESGGASTGSGVGATVGLMPAPRVAVCGVADGRLARVGIKSRLDCAPGCDSSKASAPAHTARTMIKPPIVTLRWRFLDIPLTPCSFPIRFPGRRDY